MKIWIVAEEEKCGCCNCHSSQLYLIASTQEGADEVYERAERGLCAYCLVDMIRQDGYTVNPPSKT